MEQAVVDAYVEAQREWLSQEPVPDQFPVTVEHLRVKRAAWNRWYADGVADGLLPGYAPDAFARWVAKFGFDPTEPRGVTGQWTSGGGSGGSTHVTTSPGAYQRGQAAARQRQAQAAQSSQDARDYAAAQNRIANRQRPAQPKGASAQAVATARAQYKIPSGKKFKALPAAKQKAATQILDATRQLSSLSGQKSSLDAQAEAIGKEMAGHINEPTRKKLQAQLDRVSLRQKALEGQIGSAQAALAAGKKAWRGK